MHLVLAKEQRPEVTFVPWTEMMKSNHTVDPETRQKAEKTDRQTDRGGSRQVYNMHAGMHTHRGEKKT